MNPNSSTPGREPRFAAFESGRVFIEDCTVVLRRVNGGSADLVYIDPPPNSRTTHRLPDRREAYRDLWPNTERTMCDYIDLHDLNPALHAAIDSISPVEFPDRAYLTAMGPAFFEAWRVHRSGGHLLLHCAEHSAPGLKVIMDAAAGGDCFRYAHRVPRPQGPP